MARTPPPPPAAREPRDRMITVVLCVLVGPFGVHRFYTGHTGIGLAQLFTMGGCGAWWFADLMALYRGTYTDADGAPLVG
ncbi:MAG: TM2 domain-containing protein [Alphaproteobacteria bacterium]|nr:TM2 domain-containing protein [Alphaproteobacteria bacterium]